MAIGLKLDLQFIGAAGDRATFGDLKRFVEKAQESGVGDNEELVLELNENDEVEGISVWLRDV
jgi:hypothetical protein